MKYVLLFAYRSSFEGDVLGQLENLPGIRDINDSYLSNGWRNGNESTLSENVDPWPQRMDPSMCGKGQCESPLNMPLKDTHRINSLQHGIGTSRSHLDQIHDRVDDSSWFRAGSLNTWCTTIKPHDSQSPLAADRRRMGHLV